MTLKLMLGASAAVLAAIFVVTPASAVSEKVRKACERKAELVRPVLPAGEKQAYIARCKANAS